MKKLNSAKKKKRNLHLADDFIHTDFNKETCDLLVISPLTLLHPFHLTALMTSNTVKCQRAGAAGIDAAHPFSWT